ncbi:MAG TPA: tetratricopeptide repeat protein, partial [Vicinamibacteria bacterium]
GIVPDNPRIDDLRKRLDREPGSRVFAQLAEELRKAGQLPEAIRVARQGLVVHPGYPSARMTLGRALMDLKDLRGARAEFEAVLRGAMDNILASRFLGECLEGLGDLGSALLQYRATLRLAPGDRNLEAQIRALEEKLTPVAAAAPPAPSPRPAALPREGAIPVLDVDGPMELETSFDKTMAWVPPAPVVVEDAPAEAAATVVEDLPPEIPIPPAPAPVVAPPVAPPPEFAPTAALAPAGPPEGAEPIAASATASAAVAAPQALNQSFPADWDPAEPDPTDLPAEASTTPESAALSSSTLAELYFNQGFTRQAIGVYQELLEREPGNDRFRARIVELEALERALEGDPVVPAAVLADPKTLRRGAIERSIRRLEGFLSAVRRA